MRIVLTMMALLGSGVALAGSGPWVSGKGNQSFFLGVEGQRFTKLNPVANGTTSPVEVGGAIQTLGAVAIGTWGLTPRFDVDTQIPVYHVIATREDEGLCEAFGRETCDTTTSVGVMSVRGKWLLFDELAGAPLSVTVSGVLRFGALTAPTRARLTNAGEGTIDLGPVLSIGRSGGMASGYWSAFVEGGYLFRTSNTTTGGGDPAPGGELHTLAEALLVPDGRLGFGPALVAYHRPDGFREFGDTDLGDIDRFGALSVTAVRVGAKLVLNSSDKMSVSASFLQTVLAANNPADAWVLGVGFSTRRADKE